MVSEKKVIRFDFIGLPYSGKTTLINDLMQHCNKERNKFNNYEFITFEEAGRIARKNSGCPIYTPCNIFEFEIFNIEDVNSTNLYKAGKNGKVVGLIEQGPFGNLTYVLARSAYLFDDYKRNLKIDKLVDLFNFHIIKLNCEQQEIKRRSDFDERSLLFVSKLDIAFDCIFKMIQKEFFDVIEQFVIDANLSSREIFNQALGIIQRVCKND